MRTVMRIKRKHIRWQIKLLIAAVLILAGMSAQMDMYYHAGMAHEAYQEAMR